MYVTDQQALIAVKNAQFSGESLVISVAVSIAESHDPKDFQARIRPDAVNTAGNTPPSRDRGAWQINDHYHPEVSDACAFDLQCAAKATYKISANGTNWSPWVTYTTGAYKKYLPRVRAALAGASSIIGKPFAGSYEVTQDYGPTDFTSEPPGFCYPDDSIDYFHNDGTAKRYPHLHCGIDFGAPSDTPILSSADGAVSFTGQDQTGFGNCVKITHAALGITTLYGHLLSFTVKQGETVKQGQEIALSNNTGNSSGPHLHFSVIRNKDGRYIDPTPYLVKSSRPPKPADNVHWQKFNAVTMNDANPVRLFLGPSDACPVLGELLPNTSVTFSAWMRGQPKYDSTVPQWDSRWALIVSSDQKGSGWVSSARYNGNPPGSTP